MQAQQIDVFGPMPNHIINEDQIAPFALSTEQISALRNRLIKYWHPPKGATIAVTVRVLLREDGTLAMSPIVESKGNGALFAETRDSAIRAVYHAQPYNMLRPDNYQHWKELNFIFDPSSK